MSVTDYYPAHYDPDDTAAAKIQLVENYSSILDRGALIEACKKSERSSATVDLTTDERINAFADVAASFHPALVELMNRWAKEADTERARDMLTIDGQTASARMWDKGQTFMDVICDVQRGADGKAKRLPGVMIAKADPEFNQQPLNYSLRQPNRSGAAGFLDLITGGRYRTRAQQRETLARRVFLSPPQREDTALRQQNKDVLRAEQVFKDDMARLWELAQAQNLAEACHMELSEQAEKDAAAKNSLERNIAMVKKSLAELDGGDTPQRREAEAKLARYQNHLENGNAPGFGPHGAVVSIDISLSAMALRGAELDDAGELLTRVREDREKLESATLQSRDQLKNIRAADPAGYGGNGALLTEPGRAVILSAATRSVLDAVKAPRPRAELAKDENRALIEASLLGRESAEYQRQRLAAGERVRQSVLGRISEKSLIQRQTAATMRLQTSYASLRREQEAYERVFLQTPTVVSNPEKRREMGL